jgi:hypothetical protein
MRGQAIAELQRTDLVQVREFEDERGIDGKIFKERACQKNSKTNPLTDFD